ncbi:MAG TPA: endopeptidase [Blastocatellia bacterium]|nr:endopeptidase [Blastocatellia bacterium]HAF23200.1 endopeptidase [Blastocatellia bacterium]
MVAVTISVVAFYSWARTKRGPDRNELTNGRIAESSPASSPSASPTLAPVPSAATTQSPTTSATQVPVNPDTEVTPSQNNDRKDLTAGRFVGTLKLIIPVLGVTPDQLVDTFSDARSEGRTHDAIDIPAPAGTPVVAAADGQIVKLFQSDRGGTTIYQLSPDKKLVFYYAHLQRYVDGLVAGKFVRQGEVIGYVGDTGNAGAGNFHLHFSISVVSDPKRYWEGININPYPLLHSPTK